MTTGNGRTTRRLTSWIESFLEYTADTPAPKIFRLWSAIATIGAALERRTFTFVANQITYPNMFILLVGRPGVGKTNAISPATKLLQQAAGFKLAPRDTTKASFLKWMSGDEARDRYSIDGVLHEYHSVALHISELGVFIKANDLELLSVMCELYDCPPIYENKRIYQGKDMVTIINPQVSILAGSQPGYMASVFPPEAWSQGFMARVVLIHSGEPSRPSLFDSKPLDHKLEAALISDLVEIKKLQGQFIFSDQTKEVFLAWYGKDGACNMGGSMPAPNFPRLESYNVRRIVHMLKLCQISSACRGASLVIEAEDFDIALDWLTRAEKVMPDVFLEMAGRSDSNTMREVWHYAWVKYSAEKKALPHSTLMSHLALQVPAYQAEKILQIMVQSGYLDNIGKDKIPMYIPKPQHVWGVV